MSKIVKIKAMEILDSRGNPTVQVEVFTEKNGYGKAMVPSGASTGSREALELRDNDPKRYGGKGVLKAVNNVNKILAKVVIGKEVTKQEEIDNLMLKADGTEFKKKLGANSILGVSLAVAKAAASELKLPLYKYVAEYIGKNESVNLPLPMINIINGGEHADNTIDFQEFMIIPVGAKTFRSCIQMAAEVFHMLKKILKSKGNITSVGDEGGFGPNISAYEAIKFIAEAVKKAGYKVGSDGVMMALDCASSELYKDKKYHFVGESKLTGKKIVRTTDELVKYTEDLVKKYPQIISIEDALAENDWDGFKKLTENIGNKIQIVGDDLFVTNPKITEEGIEKKVANSILIKVNQIGSLTETVKTIKLAQAANWTTVISHRSGETEDTTIADLAVGLNCKQIKTGSMSRSERIAKYNRLLEIEDELGKEAKFAGIKTFDILKK